jgi:hypothetical protein
VGAIIEAIAGLIKLIDTWQSLQSLWTFAQLAREHPKTTILFTILAIAGILAAFLIRFIRKHEPVIDPPIFSTSSNAPIPSRAGRFPFLKR